MRTFAIARRELGAYFKSPIAYIVVGVFVAITGFQFFEQFFMSKNASMSSFFYNMPLIMLFFGPAIAMRLIAEEKASGSIELLLTLPVRDWEVIAGKYLAGLGLLTVAVLLTVPFAWTVSKLGPLDMGPVIGGYVGTIFLGGTYLAIGVLASATTRNQIVAFIIGLLGCFAVFLMSRFVGEAGATVGPIIEYASPEYHFRAIARGVVELKSVVYYLSTIAVLLLVTVQVLEARKWR
jgi:ABC-2 type transport system permease protein